MALKFASATNRIVFYCYDRSTGSAYTGATTVFSAKIRSAANSSTAAGTGTFETLDGTNAPGWFVYKMESQTAPATVSGPYGPVLVRILSTDADHRFTPAVHAVFPLPDWDGTMKGAGFNGATDCLEAIRDALEDAFTPVVRDD